MRVLVANHSLVKARGSETYVRTIAEGLLKLGHRVTCFSESVGVLGGQLRSLGASVVADARDAERPDVIHASHLDSAQLAMAAWPLVPVVFVVHGRGTAEPLERPPTPAASIERWVAISDTVAEFMSWRDEIDPADITVIPNPINLDRFRPLAPLCTPPNRGVLLGRSIEPGFRQLVADAARQSGIDLRFVGDRYQVADVRNELQRADVVMSIGRGALEAAACGVPVVVISPLGSDGLLTPEVAKRELAHNYSGLAVRTIPTAAELAEQLSAATAELGRWSREWVEEHHDSVVIVPRLVALYTEAIEQAQQRLAAIGPTGVLEARYRELYPALRWWHRLPKTVSSGTEQPSSGWPVRHIDEEAEAEMLPILQMHERQLAGLDREAKYWRRRYERLASSPAIAAGLWMRNQLRSRRGQARGDR